MIYDFAVIGGGIAGASAAYELAAHGTVLLLEAESSMGYHSTGRSAALFTRNYGGPVVRQINDASAGFFANPPEGLCDTPLLRPRGGLMVAARGHEQALEPILALSRPGEEVCRIDPEEALKRAPFLRPERVADAIYEANVKDIEVASLHQGYLKGARKRGAQMLVNQAVTRLERAAGIWRISAAAQHYKAARVVNAAGAWAEGIGALAGARPIGLVPKRRTAILLEAPEGVDMGRLPVIDFAGSEAYMKPDAGQLMVSPGDETPSAPMDAWADDMEIAVLADWIERETRLKVTRIAHSWAGLRSFVADGAPVVGFDPEIEDFFWLAGQGGYGIMMSPTLASLTADLCTRRQSATTTALAAALAPERLDDAMRAGGNLAQ